MSWFSTSNAKGAKSNLDFAPALVEFQLRGLDGQLKAIVQKEIPGRGMFSTPEILKELGTVDSYGPLAIVSINEKPILAVSRVFTSQGTGGYFEALP